MLEWLSVIEILSNMEKQIIHLSNHNDFSKEALKDLIRETIKNLERVLDE